MIAAKDAVVWVNNDTHEVMVQTHQWGAPEQPSWSDPIGASYSGWNEATDAERVKLMLETAIDLAMQGFPLDRVLRAFATVTEFRALGGKSYPMCRALTMALVGRRLEPTTMSFEELLAKYADQPRVVP
jgi:hypothetical protein